MPHNGGDWNSCLPFWNGGDWIIQVSYGDSGDWIISLMGLKGSHASPNEIG
jgi:hypothetical protein